MAASRTDVKNIGSARGRVALVRAEPSRTDVKHRKPRSTRPLQEQRGDPARPSSVPPRPEPSEQTNSRPSSRYAHNSPSGRARHSDPVRWADDAAGNHRSRAVLAAARPRIPPHQFAPSRGDPPIPGPKGIVRRVARGVYAFDPGSLPRTTQWRCERWERWYDEAEHRRQDPLHARDSIDKVG